MLPIYLFALVSIAGAFGWQEGFAFQNRPIPPAPTPDPGPQCEADFNGHGLCYRWFNNGYNLKAWIQGRSETDIVMTGVNESPVFDDAGGVRRLHLYAWVLYRC